MPSRNLKQKDALTEAVEVFTQRVEIPDRYVEALYFAQFFEVLLDDLYSSIISSGSKYFKSIGLEYEPGSRVKWNANDYLKRLEIFFPMSLYKVQHKKLKNACEARNNFIHKCFKTQYKDGYAIGLDRKALQSNTEVLKKIDEWIIAYSAAVSVLISWIYKVKKQNK